MHNIFRFSETILFSMHIVNFTKNIDKYITFDSFVNSIIDLSYIIFDIPGLSITSKKVSPVRMIPYHGSTLGNPGESIVIIHMKNHKLPVFEIHSSVIYRIHIIYKLLFLLTQNQIVLQFHFYKFIFPRLYTNPFFSRQLLSQRSTFDYL